ncbi:hypothetical protein LTR27_011613 [Elasticomyces elasticus]|nr:hypothetical protein LTR27_011613 [Elasticomyces elasticus]
MTYHRSIGKSIDEKEASQIEDGLAGGMAGLDIRKAIMGIPNLMSHFADFRSTGAAWTGPALTAEDVPIYGVLLGVEICQYQTRTSLRGGSVLDALVAWWHS